MTDIGPITADFEDSRLSGQKGNLRRKRASQRVEIFTLGATP